MTDVQPTRPQSGRENSPPPLETGAAGGKDSRRRSRGVSAGRFAAAGVGIAAMLGLAANMQLAAGREAQPSTSSPATATASSAALLRWEQGARQRLALEQQRLAAARVRKPIVLTPHTVVHTVGGGGSSGGSGGSYAGSYSAPAPAAAPVASSGGSH